MAMAIALENFEDTSIAKMSKQMLKHRAAVLQTAQIDDLLGAYAIAAQKRPQTK